MAPHGPGMTGATHSHNPEYPEDSWNLYAMLDPTTTALNVTKPEDAVGIFKPYALRLNHQPEIISDADGEVIVIARFTSPVHVRKMMIIGGGNEGNHPSLLRCYVNKDGVDFTSVDAMFPSQEFRLPINSDGTVELITALTPFTNVLSIAFYFPHNHGDLETTVIKYIGLQGEHTHYRREAVDATYEVLCNGQDIKQPEDSMGAHVSHLH